MFRSITMSSVFVALLTLLGRTAIADLQDDAIAAWQKMDRQVSVGQAIYTSSRTRKGELVYKNKNSSLLRNNERFVQSDGAGSSSESDVKKIRNHKGYFGIAKKSTDKNWMLSFAEPLDSSSGQSLLPINAVEVVLSWPIKVFGTNLARISKSATVKFSNWERFTDSAANERVRFSLIAEEDAVLRVPKGQFDFVVDPSHDFRIISCEYRTSDGRRFITRYSYGPGDSSPFPVQDELIEYDQQGIETARSVNEIVEVLHTPPPDEVFELTTYGIDDVEFAKSRSFFHLTLLVVGIFCLAALWFFRSKKPQSVNVASQSIVDQE